MVRNCVTHETMPVTISLALSLTVLQITFKKKENEKITLEETGVTRFNISELPSVMKRGRRAMSERKRSRLGEGKLSWRDSHLG